jgi:hypothetical protein
MLPMFIESEHVNDNWFLIWDTHQWFKATGIFAEAADANGKDESLMEPTEMNVEGTIMDPEYMLRRYGKEGGPKPASAPPSAQPSTYRRMR